MLLDGSENSTHTILRFRRKLNTCDDKSDVPITVRVVEETKFYYLCVLWENFVCWVGGKEDLGKDISDE